MKQLCPVCHKPIGIFGEEHGGVVIEQMPNNGKINRYHVECYWKYLKGRSPKPKKLKKYGTK